MEIKTYDRYSLSDDSRVVKVDDLQGVFEEFMSACDEPYHEFGERGKHALYNLWFYIQSLPKEPRA